MDIYDTVQDKGVDLNLDSICTRFICTYKAPSRATIQQELMVEEIGDHSVRGQTSWLSSGLKIQETQ
jgi:hypothetical protein